MYQSFMECDAEEIQKQMSSTDLQCCPKYIYKKGKISVYKIDLVSLPKGMFPPQAYIVSAW